MEYTSSKHEESVAEIFEQTLDETTELLVVNPAAEAVAELIEVVATRDGERPRIRLFATDRTLKDAFEDFLTASNTADLVEENVLSIRAGDLSHNTLAIAQDVVFALVAVEQRAAALASEDDAFVTAVKTTYENRWESADQYSLRTPPISRVRETLEAEIDAETREDFDRMLDALETAPSGGGELNEVTISLLVAAKNNVLLYDISRWGEDVGIASKATFSRTKTQLEERGLIDTEKVPINVGRPRLRLQLGDERLKDADAEEFISLVRDELSS